MKNSNNINMTYEIISLIEGLVYVSAKETFIDKNNGAGVMQFSTV